MATTDPRVDTYIERAADFAKPILLRIREIVHEACPEVEETIKWQFPHFMYHGTLCSMASFKEHCALSFPKAQLIVGDLSAEKVNEAMGEFGRIRSLEDLPAREAFLGYVREAMHLNESGIKLPRASRSPQPLETPEDLLSALGERPSALEHFEGFSPSHKREYVEWIQEAKRDETRKRRIMTAVEWIAEGKPRNWKYMK